MGKALAMSVAVTIVASAASLVWVLYRHPNELDRLKKSLSRNRTNDSPGSSSTEINDENAKTEEDQSAARTTQSLHERFSQAASSVLTAKNLTAQDRLALYGLYKQATVGDAPPQQGGIPWSTGAGGALGWAEAVAKWEAWNRRRGTSVLQASREYVELATGLLLLDAETATTNSSSLASSEDFEEECDDASSGDETARAFAAPRVSQPVLGPEDADDDVHDGPDLNGNGGYSFELTKDRSRQLLAAASKNDVAVLQRILAAYPEAADCTDGSGQTALHLASDRGNLECVRLLVQSGASVSASDRDGISVLQAAVIAGNVEICQILLENGADPDQPDVDGDTPRSCATDDGSEALRVLFEAQP
jgi:acyl-CoA-binding protein